MHHFARRTAGIIAAVSLVTVFAAGCDKDDKDGKSETGMATMTTTMAPMTDHDHDETGEAKETKIATRNGEIEVSGDFLAKYNELGGPTGALGMPTGEDEDAPGGGKYQDFAGGAIYSSPATGTHVVWGEIRKAWDENGGPGGKLGYPTTDEMDIADGKQSDFTGGTITWVDNQITVTEK
ncbi:esterase [Nocardia huaxiensis]|uniref:Esterase n=1 Tax=Nocardia huaxiensis TaxID=2755382 RepID=A0A7D6ZLL2_9NOCA|nr:esterase [Nocardia huaxiensis]QLY32720.1 esterase [Nocardia huaxiensis]